MDHEAIQKHLSLLESDVLRCKVCGGQLSNAACLSGCGHSFCNHCLTGRRSCPECQVPIIDQEKDVICNRVLNEAVRNFHDLSKVVNQKNNSEWTLCEFIPSSSTWCEEDMFAEYNMPKAFSGMFQSLSCQYCGDLFSIAVCIKVCGHSFCSLCIRRVLQNNNTGVHRQKNMCITCRTEMGQNSERQLVANRAIQHAVLHFKNAVRSFHGVEIPSEGSRSSARQSGTRSSGEELIRSRFPPRNFDKMKLREMRELCGQYGLSTDGNEQTVRNRIKYFSILWNSETQSIAPRTPSELLHDMGRIEIAQRTEQIQTLASGSGQDSDYLRRMNAALNHQKGAAGSQVTSGNQRFDARLRAGFAQLKQQAMARMNQQITKNSDQVFSTPSKNQKYPCNRAPELGDGTGTTTASINRTSSPKDALTQQSTGMSDQSVVTTTEVLSLFESATNGKQTFETIEDDNSVVVLTNEEGMQAIPRPSSFDTTNKENSSTSSPLFSEISVACTSKYQSSYQGTKDDQCAHRCETLSNGGLALMTPSEKKRPSPASRNSSSSKAASGARKQRCIPWECTFCTFINDGKTLGFCTVCQYARHPTT
ncbi:zinc finger C3HC4 type domain containing protein [Nitzschia inconspicua]|uniref:Zinc finger C3HC4 type domain containing protein n=1 Tax=Nitzschia inconspicua TaxID=303405 RepID=A0A9K3PJA7_9STRA|nr:zinc finger C3HC4 type domain containing protein [Nitzschia inconspicua]